jgi:mono/diheme cytochrome c family protein
MIDVGHARKTAFILVGFVGLFGASSCTAPGGPDRIKANEFGPPHDAGLLPTTTTDDAGIMMVTQPLTCAPAMSSERMPPRSTITTGAPVAAQPDMMFTSDLFEHFSKICGGCHVQASYGNFSVSLSNFKATVTMDVLMKSIESNDPATYMPPAGSPNAMRFDDRPDTDPVKQLDVLLRQWIGAGSPADSFVVMTPGSNDQTMAMSAGYMMTDALGAALTNIGTCIPPKQMVGTDTTDMDRLDAFFASATQLPATLGETDFTTFDSQVLANNGVISYAPTYPLWTDNAGKLRYIRVPRGQAVTFDKTTQKFTIPANTRFYKTFLKEVVDANGNQTYRKIETRMIVSRPDTTLPNGTIQQNALYGTYIWSDDESQAILQADPLNNGKPFSDLLKTYITDEQKAQAIIDSQPPNLQLALSRAGLLRHYAVPGAERCVHCHMGSGSASFVLGFLPLQVNRLPQGTSGVIEAAMGDELTQLQRFIDYGLIKGMTSPSDVLPLEKSEGTRAPRNAAELKAQAYMLGNCSHCHNPRGFPSTKEPLLKPVLDFLPSATGGIFQFSLTTPSPVRKRGINHDIDIPYITPSLYDLPSDAASIKYFCPQNVAGAGNCEGGDTPQYVMAPWRSLIYRNIDTPYDYFDDSVPFPHMPLDSPGYDCRAKQIIGDWMVGITAALKDESKPEFVTSDVYSNTGVDWHTLADLNPQPYVEAHPGDSNYAHAVIDTNARINAFHTGHRYNFCPPDYTNDIVDSVIQDEVNRGAAVSPHTTSTVAPNNSGLLLMSDIGVPARPHWVNFDDTDPPGDWSPRRADWQTFLVKPDIKKAVQTLTTESGRSADAPTLTSLLTDLKAVTLDAKIGDGPKTTRDELTKLVPFGLWKVKPGCDFSGEKKVQDIPVAERPTWMSVDQDHAVPDAPVLFQSAGAAIFTAICYNCHGALADSKGLLADEIGVFTGGAARVANFRDGLLGPVTDPGTNRSRVFSPVLSQLGAGVTADDLTARYMAFMALGGTNKHLPDTVLGQVAQTPVVGVLRQNAALAGTPDMLRLGLELCGQIALASRDVHPTLSSFAGHGHFAWSMSNFGLIDTNGDAELWLRLCNLNNRPIVRAITPLVGTSWSTLSGLDALPVSYAAEYWGVSEPDANGKVTDWYGPHPVMDQLGQIKTGLDPDNWFPICIQAPTAPAEKTAADTFLQAHPIHGGPVIPYCPDTFVTTDHQLQATDSTGQMTYPDGVAWATRGAINAALAVFLYVDQMERDPTKRQLMYDQCDLIGK